MGWRSADESLFGKCGDPKLTVSVSFGTSALFKWKAEFCPDSEASSCWPDHFDLLINDGQCQEEFVHCSGPGNLQHVAPLPLVEVWGDVLLTNVCARFICFCHRVWGRNVSFLGVWVLLRALLIWGVLALLVSPFMSTEPGLSRCPNRWADVGEGIILVAH